MESNGARIGRLSLLALVALRLALGWHFYRDGTTKVQYDANRQRFDVVFNAEGFLRQAKGPLAPVFHGLAGDGHAWQQLLKVPRQSTPETSRELDKWVKQYNARRDAATRNKESGPREFPPVTPYHEWATQVIADWETDLKRVTELESLTPEQREEAAETFLEFQQRLSDYLADEAGVIELYRHELWRLHQWKSADEAGEVPFVDDRISAKTAELASMHVPWLQQVEAFEEEFHARLRELAAAEPAGDRLRPEIASAVAQTPQQRLEMVNLAVTCLTLGVGICLLAGLFTRLAALAGALFLASVILTQPPWIAGSEPTYYQLVECAGMLVVMATGAGRWLGLDAIGHALWRRCCGKNDATG